MKHFFKKSLLNHLHKKKIFEFCEQNVEFISYSFIVITLYNHWNNNLHQL